MKRTLILTLGHGASAILIDDETGEILSGYQNERISGVKGDSRFPALAIEEIMNHHLIPLDVSVYVSHWHPSGDVDQMSAKHWNKKYLHIKFSGCTIVSTNSFTTHHDTHALSAHAYNHTMKEGEHIVVADGFGTMGEVLSIYEFDGVFPTLIHRSFGFEGSLGLLYQYATDYVGWKQNQDEWKLNAMANQIDGDRKLTVSELAITHANTIIQAQRSRTMGHDDPITSLGALSYTHKAVVDLLSTHFPADDKAGIAFFLQETVSLVIEYWLKEYGIGRCTFVGGCFLNVQLNGELAEGLDSTCVMPLSGDEGAGLGIYKYFNPDFIIPDDLCWGRRHLDGLDRETSSDFIYTVDVAKTVRDLLSHDYIVNVVRGTMEFGPRAYCNTSTLALPSVKNRAYINHLNERHESMPMCPVVTHWQYSQMFEPIRIVRSVQHMIMAVPFKQSHRAAHPGVSYTTAMGVTTGRPQVVDSDHWMNPVLSQTGPLINTSFNNHGQPIVWSVPQILAAHDFMMERDTENRVFTVIDISETNQSASGTF